MSITEKHNEEAQRVATHVFPWNGATGNRILPKRVENSSLELSIPRRTYSSISNSSRKGPGCAS